MCQGGLCEAGLYGRIASKKTAEEQNNKKRSSVPGYTKTEQKNIVMKCFGLNNQISNSQGQNGLSMRSEELVKVVQPVYHTNSKAWRRFSYGVRGSYQSRVFAPGEGQIESDKVYFSITQTHLERSLLLYHFYSCKIIDPKHTSKFYQR